MLAAAMFVGSIAVGELLLLGSRGVLGSPSLERVNYAGRKVPTAAGLLFVPACLVAFAAARLFENGRALPVFGFRESLLVLVIGMCFFGLLDDLVGDRDARGFRGHFSALFRGRVTTGMLKAAGGFLVALVASFPFSPSILDLLLNAALISLCANLFNLLDMRPGRAIKVFIPSMVAVVAVSRDLGDAFVPYALSVGAVALVLFPGDLKGKYMLGDAGSNVLGATVGMGLAVGLGAWWRLGLLILVVALNVLSEKISFSRLIAKSRALSWLDALGRKGESGPGANH